MNQAKSLLFATVVLSILLSACGQDTRVQALETQMKELDTKVKILEGKIQELSWANFLNEQRQEGVAYLTPGSNGYSVVNSDLGLLIVSLDNIQPYASGSKVTLRFGNLMAGRINGLKAKLEWGSLDKKGKPINEKTKSREVKFNESLRSGSWTRVDVVLEGISPTELDFVRVREVEHTGISLFGSR
jgi:hypothetical protein